MTTVDWLNHPELIYSNSFFHEKLNYIHQNPVEDIFDEAWNYTNAGYIVYLTAYNWRYYEGLAGKYKYSGHIATCYPTENYENGNYLTANIIQAGGTTDIRQLQQVWSSINNVQVRIYLEYILK